VPVLVGNEIKIRSIARDNGLSIDRCRIAGAARCCGF